MSLCRWCNLGTHSCKCEESKKYQGPSKFTDPEEVDKETYDRERGYGEAGVQGERLSLKKGWDKRLESISSD